MVKPETRWLRELDALVAERVMGWSLVQGEDGYWRYVDAEGRQQQQFLSQGWGWSDRQQAVDHELPRFSANIAAAWRVVERMLNHDDQVAYLLFVNEMNRLGWCAPRHSACVRICRSALTALGADGV